MSNMLNKLTQLEKSVNVSHAFRYKDTSAWIHIKFHLFVYNTRKQNQQKWRSKKINILFLLTNIFRLFGSSGKTILFFGSSRGLRLVSGRIIDLYWPYKHADIRRAKSFYTLNKVSDSVTFNSFYKDNSVISDNIFNPFFGIIARTLALFGNKSKFGDIADVCHQLNIETTTAQLRHFYIDFIVKYRFYTFIFSFQRKCTCAYIVSAYSKSYICAALKKHAIYITEIQHGHIGRFHVGYNFQNIDYLPIPDKILVYNNFWAKEIEHSHFTKTVDYFDSLSYELAAVESSPLPDIRYILFTGQGMNEKAILHFFESSREYLIEEKCYLVYKPHPSENSTNSVIQRFMKDNADCFIYYEGTTSAEKLISSAKAHISVSSFCHFHAIHFLKKTFILNIDNQENIFAEYCRDFSNEFTIIKNIRQIKSVMHNAT